MPLFDLAFDNTKRAFPDSKRDIFGFWVVWVKSNVNLCNVKINPNASSCAATIPSFCGKSNVNPSLSACLDLRFPSPNARFDIQTRILFFFGVWKTAKVIQLNVEIDPNSRFNKATIWSFCVN
jgi:hypothetical protein